jgi:hypothetical protein
MPTWTVQQRIKTLIQLNLAAQVAGVNTPLIRESTVSINEISELLSMIDPRKLQTYERAQRIKYFKAQGLKRAAICEAVPCSPRQYQRAIEEYL